MPELFLPVSMRHLTDDAQTINVSGQTLGEVIDNADKLYPGIKQMLVPDGNNLKAGWTAVCGQSPAQYGLRERVEADMEIHFVPAISGGADINITEELHK